MADTDRAEGRDEQEEKQKKGGFPVMLVAIIGGMLLLGIVAFVIVFKVLTAPPKEKADEAVETPKEVFVGQLFTFDEPIIVNLAQTQGQRYLKVSVQFEVSDSKVIDELKLRTPQILDLLIGVLSSKTVEDVANTVGRNRLRREIIDKSNAQIISGKIINVYFTEFVIQ